MRELCLLSVVGEALPSLAIAGQADLERLMRKANG